MCLISVIVPCFNAERWLASTLESILQQGVPDMEIIVVDDGSSDTSREIARGYRSRGVELVLQENKGGSAARNTGFRKSKGQFIAFVDADDLMASDKLSKQLKRLLSCGSDTIVHGPWAPFQNNLPNNPAPSTWVTGDLSPLEFLRHRVFPGAMIPPVCWLTPRNLIEEAGLWDERLSMGDDGEFFNRVVAKAALVAWEGGAWSFYRQHEQGDSYSRRPGKAFSESLVRAIEGEERTLLSIDQSSESLRLINLKWNCTAVELYPEYPDLSDLARSKALANGTWKPILQGKSIYGLLAKIAGWKFTRRIQYSRFKRDSTWLVGHREL